MITSGGNSALLQTLVGGEHFNYPGAPFVIHVCFIDLEAKSATIAVDRQTGTYPNGASNRNRVSSADPASGRNSNDYREIPFA